MESDDDDDDDDDDWVWQDADEVRWAEADVEVSAVDVPLVGVLAGCC